MEKLVNYSSEEELDEANYKKSAERAWGAGRSGSSVAAKRQIRTGAARAKTRRSKSSDSSSSNNSSSSSDSSSGSSCSRSSKSASPAQRRNINTHSNGGQHKNENSTKHRQSSSAYKNSSRNSEASKKRQEHDNDSRYKRESPRDFRDNRQYKDFGNHQQQKQHQRKEYKSYNREYDRESNANRFRERHNNDRNIDRSRERYNDRNVDRSRDHNSDNRIQQRRFDDNRTSSSSNNHRNASFQSKQGGHFNDGERADRSRDFGDRSRYNDVQQRNYRHRNEHSDRLERYGSAERRSDNYRQRREGGSPALRQNQHKRFDQRDEHQMEQKQYQSRQQHQRVNSSRTKSHTRSRSRTRSRSYSHSRETKSSTNIMKDGRRAAAVHTSAEVSSHTKTTTPSFPVSKISAKSAVDIAKFTKKSISPEATPTDSNPIQLPSYYNPNVINPSKYAEQVQKRKLIWGAKKTEDTSAKWGNAQFSHDSDGKVASKFMRLMGIKGASTNTTTKSTEPSKTSSAAPDVKNREAMFSSMEQQYEVARQATHTMRGVGLGFSSQARQF